MIVYVLTKGWLEGIVMGVVSTEEEAKDWVSREDPNGYHCNKRDYDEFALGEINE